MRWEALPAGQVAAAVALTTSLYGLGATPSRPRGAAQGRKILLSQLATRHFTLWLHAAI